MRYRLTLILFRRGGDVTFRGSAWAQTFQSRPITIPGGTNVFVTMPRQPRCCTRSMGVETAVRSGSTR